MTPQVLTVSFVAKKACCGCADHIMAGISCEAIPRTFAAIHLPHDRYDRKSGKGNIEIECNDTLARRSRWSDQPEYTAGEVAIELAKILSKNIGRTIKDLEQLEGRLDAHITREMRRIEAAKAVP